MVYKVNETKNYTKCQCSTQIVRTVKVSVLVVVLDDVHFRWFKIMVCLKITLFVLDVIFTQALLGHMG